VWANRLPIAGKLMNCLGSERLLAGHSRVPDPPERMTGLIFMKVQSFFDVQQVLTIRA
jgi:hypothetical protein